MTVLVLRQQPTELSVSQLLVEFSLKSGTQPFSPGHSTEFQPINGDAFRSHSLFFKFVGFEGVKFENTKNTEKTNYFSLKFLIQSYITDFLIS